MKIFFREIECLYSKINNISPPEICKLQSIEFCYKRQRKYMTQKE